MPKPGWWPCPACLTAPQSAGSELQLDGWRPPAGPAGLLQKGTKEARHGCGRGCTVVAAGLNAACMPEMLECTRSHAGRRSARTILVWIVAIRNWGLRGLNRAHTGRHRAGRLDLGILDPWLSVRVVAAAERPAAFAVGAPAAAGVHLVKRDSHGGGASGGKGGGLRERVAVRPRTGSAAWRVALFALFAGCSGGCVGC